MLTRRAGCVLVPPARRNDEPAQGKVQGGRFSPRTLKQEGKRVTCHSGTFVGKGKG